ncbi:UNVERIFIED_CONTAM: hypothetical protein FKN15_033524 [Acipenser sinensis]
MESCRGKQGHSAPFRLGCIAASLMVLHLFDSFKPPTKIEALFYLLSFRWPLWASFLTASPAC